MKVLMLLAFYPVACFLWLACELLYFVIFRVTDLMLWIRPRDSEWMPREIFTEMQAKNDQSSKEMFNVLNTALKGAIAK
jgi:hypothetical protein